MAPLDQWPSHRLLAYTTVIIIVLGEAYYHNRAARLRYILSILQFSRFHNHHILLDSLMLSSKL